MLVCAGAFVCVRVCVCVRVYALRIVSRDKILRFTNTFIINQINTTFSTSTHPLNSQTMQKGCFANQEKSVL